MLKDNPGVAFAARRVKCGWGEWSLVEATLLAVQAAVDARTDVVPVGLRYLDRRGARSQVVDYDGDVTFVKSLWRILGARGLCCEVHPLAPISAGAGLSRHEVAQQARAAIAARLELRLEDAVPDRIRAIREG